MGEALVSRRGGGVAKCKITVGSVGATNVRFTEAPGTALNQGQSVEVLKNSIIWIQRSVLPYAENLIIVNQFNGQSALYCIKGDVTI